MHVTFTHTHWKKVPSFWGWGLKWLTVTKIHAYNCTELITAVKWFFVHVRPLATFFFLLRSRKKISQNQIFLLQPQTNMCKESRNRPHLKNRSRLWKRKRQLILSLLSLNINSHDLSLKWVSTYWKFLIGPFWIDTRISPFHDTGWKIFFCKVPLRLCLKNRLQLRKRKRQLILSLLTLNINSYDLNDTQLLNFLLIPSELTLMFHSFTVQDENITFSEISRRLG